MATGRADADIFQAEAAWRLASLRLVVRAEPGGTQQTHDRADPRRLRALACTHSRQQQQRDDAGMDHPRMPLRQALACDSLLLTHLAAHCMLPKKEKP